MHEGGERGEAQWMLLVDALSGRGSAGDEVVEQARASEGVGELVGGEAEGPLPEPGHGWVEEGEEVGGGEEEGWGGGVCGGGREAAEEEAGPGGHARGEGVGEEGEELCVCIMVGGYDGDWLR